MESKFHTLDPLEQAVGLRFNNYALLQRAFVHRSYLHEADEENRFAGTINVSSFSATQC